MRVKNESRYQTRDVRSFITWVSNQEGWTPDMRKRLTVLVVNARKWHSGCAWRSCNEMEIRLPPPDRLIKAHVAALVAHELKHITDKRHRPYSTERAMRGRGRYSLNSGEPEKYWAGAEELNLRSKEAKKKAAPTPYEKAMAGLDKAEKMVAKHERKLKLAKTLVAKWSKKAKYYAKRAEALKDAPPPASRKRPEPTDDQKVRRELGKFLTRELRGMGSDVEVYDMCEDKSQQASGLRHPDEEGWGGYFTDLNDARRRAQPGETIMVSTHTRDGSPIWIGEPIEIPDRETLLEAAASGKEGHA